MATFSDSDARSSTDVESIGIPTEYDIEKCTASQSDGLLQETATGLSVRQNSNRRSHLRGLTIYLLVIVGFAASFFAGKAWEASKLEDEVFARSSIRSPIKKDISPKTRLVRFNGTLDWKYSPFRGHNRTAVDAAWDEYENVGFFPISEQEVIDMGSSLDAIRLPESYGGGYMAQAEFTHKIHCLNYIRKGLYFNYDYYKTRTAEFSMDTERNARLHIEHCLEITRQDIMCNADNGVFTAHWLKGYPRPYANFNVWKTCRNHEDVHQWAKSRAFDPPSDWNLLKVPGHVEWDDAPQPSQFPDPPPFP